MTSREERMKHLERLLEEATEGEEPLQKALTVIKIMRDALEEDKEWVIEVQLDYRDVKDLPKYIIKRVR